jgi:hypothetical protein
MDFPHDEVGEEMEVKPSFALDDRSFAPEAAKDGSGQTAGGSRFLQDDADPQQSDLLGDNGSALDERSNRLRRESLLPVSFVLDQLRLEVERSDLYVDMIIFLPFLILFITLFQIERNVEQNFYVMNAIRSQYQQTEFPGVAARMDTFRQEVTTGLRLWVELDLHYADIGNQGDWGDFLNDAVIATTWDCVGDTAATHEGLYAARGQMLLVGAMRLRTLRNNPRSCGVFKDIYSMNASVIPQTCYAIDFDKNSEDRNQLCPDIRDPANASEPLIRYRSANEIPGIPILGNLNQLYPSRGHVVEIPFNSYSCDQAAAIGALVTSGICTFADNWATRFIVLEMFLYTPSTDSFHSVKYYSEVTASGYWWNSFQLRSFGVYSELNQSNLIFGCFFFAFIVYYLFSLFYQSVVAIKEKRFLKHIFQLWTFFEVANLAFFMTTFIIKFIWVKKSLAAADALRFPFPQQYPDHLDVIQTLDYTVIVINCVNTIITFLKLLKYVRLSAQLGVITRTLAACTQSMMGVLVLFGFVVLSYAIAGWSLFGINMAEFRDIGTSFSSLLQLLVGANMYDGMKEVNRFLAGAFYWSYLILALYLLLNFIIAILSEAFAKISGRAVAMSLDEMLVRKLQFFRMYLLPRNLLRIARGVFSRKTESSYILRVVEQLANVAENEETAIAEQRVQRKKMRAQNIDGAAAWPFDPVLDDDDQIVVYMRFADLLTWIEPDCYEGLSQLYFEYTWDELINEYDDFKKASEQVDSKQMMQMVEAGVMRVVANDLAKVDQLDHVLETLESHVEAMIEAVVATSQ